MRKTRMLFRAVQASDRGHFTLLALALSGVLLLLSACYPGIYRLDIFPEMHYQPSHRPYAPPHGEANPAAVPVTGRPVPVLEFNVAADLRNPVTASPETIQHAQRLFQVNCSPCHGKGGRGDGVVASYFENAQLPKPVDFSSTRTRARTDGQLFFIISNGLGNMPSFERLLSPNDRWHLVLFMRSVQNQNPPS